jgi:hypothetical protein
VNVRCGFWLLAQRAAADLGDLLAFARKHRLADAARGRSADGPPGCCGSAQRACFSGA